MGGITSFIKKVCVQSAVYWAPAALDGYGTRVVSLPVQIKCRWDNKSEYIRDKQVAEQAERMDAKAEIMVLVDLEIGGHIYLGSAASIQSYAESNGLIDPAVVPGAEIIIGVQKTPMVMSSTEFIRKVFI